MVEWAANIDQRTLEPTWQEPISKLRPREKNHTLVNKYAVCKLPQIEVLLAGIRLRMRLSKLGWLLLVSVGSAFADPIAGASLTTPTPEVMFSIFEGMRTVATHVGHNEPRFYSRAWIENAIDSALKSQNEPTVPGLNWAVDSLLASLSTNIWIDKVYSYKLIDADSEQATLEMQVGGGCKAIKPSTVTIQYVREDGLWRINHVSYDGTTAGTRWYRPDLTPIREFSRIPSRDRSRYMNESNLGRALDLHIKPTDCDQEQGVSTGDGTGSGGTRN